MADDVVDDDDQKWIQEEDLKLDFLLLFVVFSLLFFVVVFAFVVVLVFVVFIILPYSRN